MKAKTITAILAVAFGALSSRASVAVFFQPASQTVALGSIATVDIVISGVDASSQPLRAWNLEFSFDSTILMPDLASIVYNSAELGDPTSANPGSFASTLEPDPQTLNLAQTSFALPSDLASEPSSFTLATISFSTDAVGISPLDWNPAVNALSDANGLVLPLASSMDGTISVAAATAVPEARVTLLMLIAFGGIAARKLAGGVRRLA
jgi:hypothetical protein